MHYGGVYKWRNVGGLQNVSTGPGEVSAGRCGVSVSWIRLTRQQGSLPPDSDK